MASNPVTYIDPSDLKELLTQESNRSSLLIVDVRDGDFPTGNIPGCLNYPSAQFLLDCDLQPSNITAKLGGFQTLVFHCALSQVRGPKCATRYATRIQENGSIDNKNQRVLVLRGGFCAWQHLYKTDTRLVENHNQDYWDAEGI